MAKESMKISSLLRYAVVCLLSVLVAFTGVCPDTADASARKKVALVMGNSTYKVSPLTNPTNDASDIAKRLEGLGFEVSKILNASQKEMEQAIRRFHRTLFAKDTVGLFYYAGHAVELRGSNYLIPVDAELHSEADVKYETVNVGRLLDGMSDANNGLNIVILDACRNNPFARSFRSAGTGLVPSNPATGTIILYATEPTNVAEDGDGRNGTFTLHLLNSMSKPGLTVEEVFKKTAISVNRATKGNQTPWSEGFILGDFYFHPPGGTSTAELPRLSQTVSRPPNTPVASAPPPPPPAATFGRANSGGAPPPPPPVSMNGLSGANTLASIQDRPPTLVAPAAKGYLQVKVNTQAKVFVDGLEQGTAYPQYPLNVSSGLASRKVHVYAKADGYETRGEYVDIKSGQWQVVSLNLSKEPSWAVPPPKPVYSAPATRPVHSAPPPRQTDKTVDAMLTACKAYMDANRLSVGKNNAVSCYRKVLKLEPSNSTALQGMASIGKKYRNLAKNAMRTNNFDQARTYVERLARINSSDHSLPGLRADLNLKEEEWKESKRLEQLAQANVVPAAPAKSLVRQIAAPAPPPRPAAAPAPDMYRQAQPQMQPAPLAGVSAPAGMVPGMTPQSGYMQGGGMQGVSPQSLYALELAQMRRQAERRECMFKVENTRLQCERDNTENHSKCREEQRERARFEFETALSAYSMKQGQYRQCAIRFREAMRQRQAREEEERNNRMMDHQTLISTLPAMRYRNVQQMCGNAPKEPKSDQFLDYSQCKKEDNCDRDFDRQRSMCDLL